MVSNWFLITLIITISNMNSILCDRIWMMSAAVRSGDYYLFDDFGEKVELDLMDAKPATAVSDQQLKRRMSTRRSLKQVSVMHTST